MTIETRQKTVGDIVAAYPVAARVFEKHQIDYCCNGKRPLNEVCAEKGIDETALGSEIESVAAGQPAVGRDWSSASLGELIGYIVPVHHDYLRHEMPWIAEKLNKLVQKHGPTHAWLVPLRDTFGSLAAELDSHMRKEEMILFPFIIRMEEARLAGREPAPAPFGTIRHPISMMEQEHESAGEALREMRSLSSNYTTPADGCATFHTTMDALARMEADLHTHIHLENNILHPRAIRMQ